MQSAISTVNLLWQRHDSAIERKYLACQPEQLDTHNGAVESAHRSQSLMRMAWAPNGNSIDADKLVAFFEGP